jgi:hypothetical protein
MPELIVKPRTFGFDLLTEGVFGKFYNLPGTGHMVRPIGIAAEPSKLLDMVGEGKIVCQVIGQSVEGPDYGADVKHHSIGYLLNKPRNLEAEKRFHPLSAQRILDRVDKKSYKEIAAMDKK